MTSRVSLQNIYFIYINPQDSEISLDFVLGEICSLAFEVGCGPAVLHVCKISEKIFCDAIYLY